MRRKTMKKKAAKQTRVSTAELEAKLAQIIGRIAAGRGAGPMPRCRGRWAHGSRRVLPPRPVNDLAEMLAAVAIGSIASAPAPAC